MSHACARAFCTSIASLARVIAGAAWAVELLAQPNESLLLGFAVLLFGAPPGGLFTAALATPFDVIKVRMQTKVYATAADPFPSMPTVWRKTVAEAGWSALTRSAFTRVVSNAPSGAIMFTVYEGGVKYIEGRLEGRA